jgi:4-hydroxythreonine-4-phosphate dehydrogenase
VAWAALERAAAGCKAGEFSGVVTGPVSKQRLAAIGWPFPGQTEFFAGRWGGEPTMAFCGERLRVTLLTWHIPLAAVAGRLRAGEFARAISAADELARAFPGAAQDVTHSRSQGGRDVPPARPRTARRLTPCGFQPRAVPTMAERAVPAANLQTKPAAPRIGVCGLNPHAGEGGLIGREEIEVIDPILDALRPRHPGLSKALPADTLFLRHLRGEFDVVVALYHDQGLAPLKAVEFDRAVNATLGLPFVRTSPDHGTAFDIAGKGRADPGSFISAVAAARRLLTFRRAGVLVPPVMLAFMGCVVTFFGR